MILSLVLIVLVVFFVFILLRETHLFNGVSVELNLFNFIFGLIAFGSYHVLTLPTPEINKYAALLLFVAAISTGFCIIDKDSFVNETDVLEYLVDPLDPEMD